MKLKLRTYTPGQMITGFHFFILNRGMNSGRPSYSPNVNSFIAEAETQEDIDRYYWLCYGLWITGKFKYYLAGSVILFIRKDELLNLLELADVAILDCQDLYLKAVSLLYEAEINTKKLTARLATLQQAKVEILRHFIRI